MSEKPRPDAMLFSLSELAFVLFLLAITAAAMIFQSHEDTRAEAVRLEEERDVLRKEREYLETSVVALEQEVGFLNEVLDEYRYGVVPCWRRPDGTIPPLVGVVTIHTRSRYEITRERSGDTLILTEAPVAMEEYLEESLRTLFQEEFTYAAANRCYLRISVLNETNSFPLYENVVSVVSRRNMVVAR